MNREEQALRIRIGQILISDMIKAGQFKVPIHLAIGHEWLAVDLCNSMDQDDKMLLSHRNIAYYLAKTQDLAGLVKSYQNGLYGSMNLIKPERGIVYTSSILGGQFPVAVGVASAFKIAGKHSMTYVLGGDGAIEEGAFYESLVLAKKLDCNIAFIIENNGWSMSSNIKSRRERIDLSTLADSVGVDYDISNYRKSTQDCSSISGINLYTCAPCVLEVKVDTFGSKNNHYHHGAIDLDIDPEYPVLFEDESKAWSRELGREILKELKMEVGL